MSSASREDPDQPGHLPSLIRVFAVGMEVAKTHVYPHSLIIVLTVRLMFT